MNFGFWLGLLLAVPLSIVANLTTPFVLQWLAKRGEASAERRRFALSEELSSLEKLASTPGRLQIFLLESILLITLVTCAFVVLGAVLFTVGSVIPRIVSYMALAGQLLVLFASVSVTTLCATVLSTSIRARNIEEYKLRVKVQLDDLTA
jgi:hypothetical protein